jgi:eukaryotic-like serine/threonine-protein kinase
MDVGKPDPRAKNSGTDALETKVGSQAEGADSSTLDGGAAVGALTTPPHDADATILGTDPAPAADPGATIEARQIPVSTPSSPSSGAAAAPPAPPADPNATIEAGHVSISTAFSRATGAGGSPKSIGPYTLIKTLGEGGMGQVWLADQTAPVRRQVALKLIKGGMYDDAVIQRFEAERQSLAIMDHPAIAKVFDAGTSDGQPYFVMEYVPGVPVTQYCDKKRLTPRERLKLFIKICEGVQHAHQKAVIHRDLKPSNILISEIDGKPAPHIIDFGIAKAATPGPDQVLLTQIGSFVGTPGYMSPEQADSNVQDIDTRTDVYALGVILYELLAGWLPFDMKTWQGKSLLEILRQIREVEPPRPSVKLKSNPKKLAELAAARSVEPRQLIQQVTGDLDWITMKAIEKDRARRYDSPNALAADIQRYLDDEPVLASPPSATYRAQKFVRRHRVAVLGAAAVGVMLVVLAVSMTVQAVRISRERDRANREAAAATSALDFLTGLFKVSDPSEARGNSITAREILDKGSKQIESSLGAQPEVQSRLMMTIGNVYQSLGLYGPAETLFEKALDTRTRVLGPQNPETLLTEVALATTLRRQGKLADAEKMLRQTLDSQRKAIGADNPDTLLTMVALATDLGEQGRRGEQESLLRQALAIQQRVLGADNPDTLRSMNNLADTLSAEGNYTGAEQLLRQALEIQRKSLGSDHPDTLRTQFNLAAVLNDEGHLSEAESMQRATLESRRRVLGPDHADTLTSMDDLASILQAENRLPEAETLRRETLAEEQKVLGPEHPWTLFTESELANTLSEEGKYAEADKLLRETLEIQRRTLGPESADAAGTEYNLACNAALSGKRDEAIALLTHALSHGLSQDSALHMEEDSDLRSLHGDARFTALVEQAKK